MVTSSATLATNCSIKPGGKVNSWDGCGDDGAGSVDSVDVLGSFLLVFFFGGVVTGLSLGVRFLDRADRLAGIILQSKKSIA